MKIIKLTLILGLLSLASCDAGIEPIPQRLVGPEAQDPVAYADYLQRLNDYKSGDHYTVCGRFENAAATIVSEKDCLRSFPDSLDIVILANPLTAYDREDLPILQTKGTKVVLTVDCSDAASAERRVDEAIASVTADALDGLAIIFWGEVTDAARTAGSAIAAKLAALTGKTFLFEGNVKFVAEADRANYAWYLIDATATEDVNKFRSGVDMMTGYYAIPSSKILPAVKVAAQMNDIDGRPRASVSLISEEVLSLSLGGLTLWDVSTDYYDAGGTYPRTREVIDFMNPAHE